MRDVATWEAGLPSETDFWRRWAANASDSFAVDFRHRMNPESQLQPLITQYLKPASKHVKILDVGAGPLTFLGKRWDDRRVELSACDALASEYDKILADEGIMPPVRTEQCLTEMLTKLYSANSFDLTFARNTLDHSLDPIAALQEMTAVTEPGGVVLVQHAEDEGLNEGYVGLHGWNFRLSRSNERLTVGNEEITVDIADALDAVARPIRMWSEVQDSYTLVFGAFRVLS